ncbi:MAG: DUF6687 family protein [Pyrinomonadaceae bacterium]
MRFEYYHAGLDDEPKLSVDGTVPNSLHFSHWQGNNTPASVKADTSTEIALNLVGSSRMEELTQGIELVTNNHFDTDGVLSVWTVLTGERALDLRRELVAAAENGDFSEYTTENAVRANIAIQGSEQPDPNERTISPLAGYLAGEAVTDEAHAYRLVLPEVERLLTRTGDYEPLWRDGWQRVADALESFARGESVVEEQPDVSLSVVTLAPALFGATGFDPARHAAPFTAITRHARGQLYLIAMRARDGWAYRIDYPYYSWAETVVRPRIERRDFAPLVALLDDAEKNRTGRWKLDASELTSAVKFADEGGQLAASSLAPDEVARQVRAVLQRETEAAVSTAPRS